MPEPEPVPEPAVPVPEPAVPEPVKRVRVQGAVRVLGGVGWNDLPAQGGGVGIAGALLFERWRIDVSGGLWPLRRVRVGASGSGGDFLLWTIGARVGPVLRPHRRLEVPLAGGFEAGQVQVRGVQLVDAADARAPWFAFVVAPALAVKLTPAIHLWLAPELMVPVVRTQFRVDAGVVHRAGAVALRGVLGLEFRFPRLSAMEPGGSGNKRRGRP